MTAEKTAEDKNTLTGPDWGTSEVDTDTYLQQLGVEPGDPADLALLERVHAAHVRTYPFSNVDVLLGQHPTAAPYAVSERMLAAGRGGLCFDHMQLFAAGLEALGFRVDRRLARVHRTDNGRTHCTVEVEADGRRWLTDPGFGMSLTGPIELADGAVRDEPLGAYRLEQVGEGASLQWALHRGETVLHYTDETPVQPVDVRGGHTVIITDPAVGPFLNMLIASRFTADGQISLADLKRTERRTGQETTKDVLTVDEALETVREVGVDLTEQDEAGLRRHLEAVAARED